MQHLATLLPSYIRTDDWRLSLMKAWPDLVGPLATRMSINQIEDTALVIQVYDPHWLHELSMMKHQLLQVINRHLGSNKMQTIRFRLAPATKRTARPIVRKARLIKPDSLPAACINHSESHLKDDELRAAALDFLARCLAQAEE